MYEAHIGDIVHVLLDPAQNNNSDVAAAIVARVWGKPYEYNDVECQTVNVRVLGDSAEVLWLTSIQLFEDRPSNEQLAAWSPLNPKGYRAVAYQPSHPLTATVASAGAGA